MSNGFTVLRRVDSKLHYNFMNIKFKYSHHYEQCLNEKAVAIPRAEILAKISAMDRFWKLRGPATEKAFNDVTGLSFVKKEIVCYLNSGRTFSDPLTLKIENEESMQNNLVHELICVLLMDNEIGFTAGWETVLERFKNETAATKTQIGIYAIHLLAATKLFPEWIKNINSYPKSPDYEKSREIVDKTGADEIVRIIFPKTATKTAVKTTIKAAVL